MPPDNLPLVSLTVPEIAAARKAGVLHIHPNGVLTLRLPGEPVRQIVTPAMGAHGR